MRRSLPLLAQTPAAPAPDPLQLRDVHLPPAPPLWPPAPGWWLLFAAVVAVLGVVAWRLHRRRQWQRGIEALFDADVEAAQSTAARVAAISELLRRASRLRDPAADRLAGEAWLRFLDAGQRSPAFTGAVARTLLDGPFRQDTAAADAEALRVAARARFVQLMRPLPWWRTPWTRMPWKRRA